MSEPLWTPSAESIERANLTRFMALVNERHGQQLTSYDELWSWSTTELADFWQAVWDFTEVRSSVPNTQVHGELKMPGTDWFPGARLNFAENLLRFRSDRPALDWFWETGERRTLTYNELYLEVARFRHTLAELGVQPGDRVAGYLPNIPEAVVAMLAAASLGAVWSSCSPDFGFKGVMDRFGQIEPKVLVTVDGYRYNGKDFSILERAREVAGAIASIEAVVIKPLIHDSPSLEGLPGGMFWSEAVGNDATELAFAQLPFGHPLYIMYSSGTTGVPKCIVHGAGGTLLQHAKEHVLHTDLGPDDSLFYFTTCGWMMWNWLVSGLLTGARVVLFEGSPAAPDLGVLWRMAESAEVTVFGTSPKFLTSCAKAGITPSSSHDLSHLRAVLSTGSPLSIENFRWVYSEVGEVQLSSICGGTDIISCFMLGSPISPVYAGEIQKRGLGMAVAAWADADQPVVGEKAELVCTKPFPSMPIGFWRDEDGSRYLGAYFDFFEGIWRHGDFIEVTEHGGVVVYGRSDATLNPGGVRIGTAEIYRQVELLDEVVDSLVVGRPTHDDVEVVLFVVLRDGLVLDEALIKRIRTQVRTNTTPRHVPSHVLQAPAVPRTISGKKVEIAVTRLLQGEAATNRDALANPESLDFYSTVQFA